MRAPTVAQVAAPWLVLLATLSVADGVARADEPSSALAAPPRGSTGPPPGPTRPPKLDGPHHEVDLVPQRWVDRPLVLPPLTARFDISTLGGGGGPYSPTFGFVPVVTAGVAPGLELSFSVPFLIGQRIEPRFGAQLRFLRAKEVELGVRALMSYPTSADSANGDFALVLLWRATPWLRVDTEARAAFDFSPAVRSAFVWPTIFTVQATSGVFLGATTELGVFPDLGRATFAVGGFIGGAVDRDGRALFDLRVGGAVRDLGSAGTSGVGGVFTVVCTFYIDARP